MEDCWGRSSSLRARCESCDSSFTVCQEPPQHVFSHEVSHLDGTHLLGIHALIVCGAGWVCVRYLSFWSVCGDCFRFCQRPDPLVVIEHFGCGFFFSLSLSLSLSLFSNISCVLRKRFLLGDLPWPTLTGRTSRTQNIRHLCPALTKAMIASRCSCRSPKGTGGLMGARLTCRSDATPVLLRPCSLMALEASLHLPPLQFARAAWARSASGRPSTSD